MKEQEQVSSMASDSRSFDRRAARLGGVSALSGAVLGMVGNLIWVPVHLGILVAFILMLGGLVAIHYSIGGGLPARWRGSGSLLPSSGPPGESS
jgi:hypothetical protein